MKRALILLGAAAACLTGGAVAFSAVQHLPFPAALYWAVETGTTVGYGDVTPTSPAARLTAAVVMLTAIPLLGAAFALVTSAHIGRRLDRHHKAIHDRLDRIEQNGNGGMT